VGFTQVLKCYIDSVRLFSFHFAGIEATAAHVLVVQTAFSFTSVLSSYSISRLSYLFLFLTHRTRSLFSFVVKLYWMYLSISHIDALPSPSLKVYLGKEADLSTFIPRYGDHKCVFLAQQKEHSAPAKTSLS